MNKKILHLIPSLEGGGAERQLAMLAVEQARRGWDVHIALRRGGRHADLLHASKVVVHQLGDYRGASPRLFLRINSLIRELKPDLVQTWLPQMDIVGGFAALCNRVPWVVSERSSRLAYQGMHLYSWVRRCLVRYANAVVANSLSGACYWRELLPADALVFQVANAVDVASIRNPVPANIEFPNLRLQEKSFLVVGRLAPEKAIDIIVKAVCLMPLTPCFSVLIIGEGPLREGIEISIRNASIEDRVLLSPYREDWWMLLKSASALVSMSRFEGQPNVVLEAMAAGCPLIVSDIPAHREFLNEDSAILVPPDNPSLLAGAMISLLAEPELSRQRAARASGCVDNMTMHLTADAYESVYEKVLSGRN